MFSYLYPSQFLFYLSVHFLVQVLVLESLSITSSSTDALSPSPRLESDADHVVNSLQISVSVAALDAFQVKDLYDHFDIKICNLEVRYVYVNFLFLFDWSCLSNHICSYLCR